MATGSATSTSIATSEVFTPAGMPERAPTPGAAHLSTYDPRRVKALALRAATPEKAEPSSPTASEKSVKKTDGVAQSKISVLNAAEITKETKKLTITVNREFTFCDKVIYVLFFLISFGGDFFSGMETVVKKLDCSYDQSANRLDVNQTFLHQIEEIERSDTSPQHKQAALQKCYELYTKLEEATPKNEQLSCANTAQILSLKNFIELNSPEKLYLAYVAKLEKAIGS